MLVETLQGIRLPERFPVWARYLASALLIFACFGIRVVLARVAPSSHLPLYLIFIPAIIASSFLFDRGSGFVAVALGAILGFIFLRDPEHSLGGLQGGDFIWVATFVVIGVLTAATVEALRVAVDRLSFQSQQLTERTAALTVAQADLTRVSRHRELLLADINHRIKNHLASVAAGLTLSRNAVADEEARAALDDAVGRLDVLSRVYTRLHITGPEVALDSKDFLEGLCSDLSDALLKARPIALIPSIERHELGAQQAVSIGLIVNELVTNAAKYAFPDDRSGEIRVFFDDSEGHCALQVIDDGQGTAETPSKAGTGVRLVKALVGQIGGTVEWHHNPGTKVKVSLPSCAA